MLQVLPNTGESFTVSFNHCHNLVNHLLSGRH